MFISSKITPQTRFRYASLTKLLTADAILELVNEKKLSLDTRMLDILSEFHPVVEPRLKNITIQHLLNHRAGFDRLLSQDPMTAHRTRPWCPDDLKRLLTLRLEFLPGSRYAYSNLGYCLLGVILERVEGQPFRELREARYGLAEKGLVLVDGPYATDEVQYDFRNSGFYTEDYYRYFDFPSLSSSAGLSGNAASLALVLKGMLNRKPLNIISAPADTDCDPREYGKCYGFAVSSYKKNKEGLMV